MLHTQQVANFYGRAGADARLWQQGSQVSAPVLEIQRAAQTLHAYGDASAAQPVHAVFPSQSSGGVVRVASHDMLYNDGTHLAVFSGGVDVTNPDSRTRSRTATVWLQNPQSQNKPGTAKPQTPPPGPALSGNVERILAEGAVTVVQPGRHATGEALNYTAKDGHYLLTGTPAQPPKLVDDVKGTVSGASLLFESNDDTVIVSSAAGYKRPQLDTHSK
jgi:lipopolysaccharide export system protein LptA